MNNMDGNRLHQYIYFGFVLTALFLAHCEKCMAFELCRPRQVIQRSSGIDTSTCAKSTIESRAAADFVASRRQSMQTIWSTIAMLSVLTGGSWSSAALSPEAASTAYDTYASSYDELEGGALSSMLGLENARRQLLQQAQGKVLEIGAGTGLNLSFYDPLLVTSLTLVDVSKGMLHEAKLRATALGLPFPVEFVIADATSQLVGLFGESTFDTVVDSFSLCVMGSEGAKSCLEQIAKVVKAQSGSILLLENSRSSNPLLSRYQDVTAEMAATAGGKGCVYNQDVEALIKATRELTIQQEVSYVAGLFRSFKCTKATT